MANLDHLFHLYQPVRCRMDGKFYKGTVNEIYPDHIIVDDQPPHTRDFSRELGGFFLKYNGAYGII